MARSSFAALDSLILFAPWEVYYGLSKNGAYFCFSTLRSSFYFCFNSRFRLSSRTFSASCLSIDFFLSRELLHCLSMRTFLSLASFSLSNLVSCSDPKDDELPLLLEPDELLASLFASICSFSESSDSSLSRFESSEFIGAI